MIDFQDLKKRLIANPELKKTYDDLAPKYEIARALIAARVKAKMTQAEVAQKMNTTQSVVSRLEGGKSFPNLGIIYRYATATNETIDLHLHP